MRQRERVWLDRKQAAERVVRSERTIRDWVTRGLLYSASNGSVIEQQLLEVDLRMRQARGGRPKKTRLE